MNNRTMSLRDQISAQLLLALAGAFVLAPLLWMLRLSFDGGIGERPGDASLIPTAFTLEHVLRAATEPQPGMPFPLLLFNSLVVSVGTALTAVAFGASAAYAFARYRFPGRRIGLFVTLVLAALPPAALATPFFIYLGWLDIRQSYLGLILVYSAVAVPFAIWTIRNAVQGVARDLEDAAMLEGAGPWAVFTRVTLPLIGPSVGAAGMIAFMIAWSEYAASALISAPQHITLAVALYGIGGLSEVSWGLMCATALLISLPVLTIFYGLNRYLLDALTFGATRHISVME
jgi:arabinogalactan oligomer / maltooligosaccharide transport system permease protein